MERHNWCHASKNEMICEQSVSWIWAKLEVDCNGCGAIVPADKVYLYSGMTGEQLRLEADIMWHKVFRPMAALVALVEEANDGNKA